MSASQNQVAAVVLAGGLGTRLRQVLPDLPKPMAPVLGRPFVEWVVRYLAFEGVREVVISTGYRAELIQRHFASRPVSNVNVQCISEPEPLGTAGGFVNAVGNASRSAVSAWLVLNGDSLAVAPLGLLISSLQDANCAGAILGLPMSDAARYGTIVHDAEGHLIRFDEKKPGAGIINAGVYLFRSQLIETFPKRMPLSFEKEVFPELIARKARLKVCVATAPFLDIGTPESLGCAENFVQQHESRFAL